jgi:hypothetical protein
MIDHFQAIAPRLKRLSGTLDDKFGAMHHFVRASARQSDAAFEAIAKRGNLSPTNFVAAMIGNTHHIRQFELSLFLSSVVVRRTIRMAIYATDEDDLLAFLWMLRTLLERFAHINFLVCTVEKKLASENAFDENASYVNMLAIDEVSKQALYGTLVHWNRIATKSLSEIDLNSDLGKNTKKELGPHAAKQVLDKIDFLEKKIKGTRAAYEVLCEFLHPNVGDLYACTSKYKQSEDRNNVIYIERDISVLGKSDGLTRTVEQVILERICNLICDICDLYESDLDNGVVISKKMVQKLQKSTRSNIRNNRKFFKMHDRCPCASGREAFECCGKNLMLDP